MQTKVITRLSGYFFIFKKGETLKKFKEDCQRARHPDRQKTRRPVAKAIHLHPCTRQRQSASHPATRL